MKLMIDAFWRAAVYCLYPRVMALSLLPFVLMAAGAYALGYFFWNESVDWVRGWLDSSLLVDSLSAWLQTLGFGSLKAALAPVMVIAFVTPLLVLVCLLVVAVLMTPALTSLVAERRFSKLERKRGGGWFTSVMWSLGSTLLALLALVVSVPLWLVPPLVMVLPPLIWGWLTYRVLTFDVLADHASGQERRELMRQHRMPLLTMGIICGYLGAAPSLIWASGAVLAAAFVILVPIAIWLYTLVFAFSSLWFAHYALAALQRMRSEPLPPLGTGGTPSPPTASPASPLAPSDAEPKALPASGQSSPSPTSPPPVIAL